MFNDGWIYLTEPGLDLVEVRCSPQSILVETTRGLGGTAERCHLANGYDLATADGFNRCRDFATTKRPKM
eukprot:5916339-Alexandrium_andersonii.AAC.1